MTTTVYIWNEGESVGHCALKIKAKAKVGSRIYYLSFWPQDECPKNKIAQLFKNRRSKMLNLYQKDCSRARCGRPADHIVKLHLPNESKQALKDLKAKHRNQDFNLANHNCCTVACDCLSILSGEEIFAFTPSGVLKKAKKLQEKFG